MSFRVLMVAVLALIGFGSCAFGQASPAVYYPGETWRTASPESQGLDSGALSAAIDEIRQKQWGVHSLLVIRHGYVVADTDFYPYSSSVPHDLASVTKTITSTLTGVAVGKGLLKLDEPVLSFFPHESPANPDEKKRAITVGNLLHMESGLDCGFLPGEQELEQMKRSANWVQFALALPMKYDPGTHPAYCSPGYHLLGAALGVVEGRRRPNYPRLESVFAQDYLFDPLAIRDVRWALDPPGSNNHGWGDSHLYPRDVAKLGYLYLHGGEWNGKQIVPRDWVAMSIAPPTGGRGNPGGLGIEWNATNGPNGLQYGGTGRGGQILIVWPELDMIIVSMAGGNAGQLAPLIRAAVKSDQALPANPEGDAVLKQKSEDASKAPAAVAVPAMPAIAKTISGNTYAFAVNSSRLDSLRLIFDPDYGSWADVKYYGEPLNVPLSLDGVYRAGQAGPLGLPAAALGKWTSENDFLLDVNFIANINHYTLALHFTADKTIEVTADEASGLIRNGHLIGTLVPMRDR